MYPSFLDKKLAFFAKFFVPVFCIWLYFFLLLNTRIGACVSSVDQKYSQSKNGVCIPRKLPLPDTVCGKEKYGQISFQEWDDQDLFDRTQNETLNYLTELQTGPEAKRMTNQREWWGGAVISGGKHSQQAGKLLEAPRSLWGHLFTLFPRGCFFHHWVKS